MEHTPILSIITVNYNGYNDTCEMIDSIEHYLRSVTYEIIIVDNASRINEAALIQEKYPSVISIRNEYNLGFSGGNNLGIEQANGKYILLLNNDTYIDDDSIHYLIDRIEQNEKIGVVSPKIKFAFPPFNIQFAGYTELSRITLRNQIIGFGENDKNEHNKAKKIPYTHGAAMLFKKEIIKKVGTLPEIYFLYYEELDWCTKVSNAGYELWYEPRCTVYHKESQSTGKQSSLRTYYLTRNRLLYAWRNRKGSNKWLSIFYQMTIVALKDCLFHLSKGRFDLVKSVISANISFILLNSKI